MQISQDRPRWYYFNHTEGVFFDERKKRFVDFTEMDKRSFMNYAYSDFTSVKMFSHFSGVRTSSVKGTSISRRLSTTMEIIC
jgi:hypothetical protein